MKLIEVVPTLEHEASGPSYSVPRLASALGELGHEVQLMSAGGQTVSVHGPVRHSRFERDLGGVPVLRTLEMSNGLAAALRQAAPAADLIHSNGLWTLPTLYPGWAAKAAGRPLVISPRGTLSPVALRRSAWRKQVFWRLAQRPVVAQAALLHATSEAEYLDMRRFGLTQPVAVIANGIDLPPHAEAGVARAAPLRRLLYLGRLHPIKGLEALLAAWGRAAPDFPDWELRLVGPAEDGYDLRLRNMAARLDLPRVTFAGPSYGAAKAAEYLAADLYVLPSLSENFGMSVAEALASSVPVVVTTGAPWAGVVAEDCGWHVPPDVGGLEGALRQAFAATPDRLRRMGERGGAWMKRDFSWEGIGRKMEAAYRWVIEGGRAPDTVRLD